MIGVDLFSGAGGMSVGAAAVGVDIRAAVEADPHAAKTYIRNHKGVNLFTGDISLFNPPDLRANGEPVCVFGGPPCRGFSTSNQRTRSQKNPSNWLFREFLRVVRTIEPDWVVLENVSGILQTEGGVFLNHIKDGLQGLGYTVTPMLLNSVEYSVPQKRERMFVVGSRRGIRVNTPKATAKRPVTVDEAIGDLPVLKNGASKNRLPYRTDECSSYARQMRGDQQDSANHLVTRNARYVLERYKHIPPGGNWENIPLRLMENYADRARCHTGIYHRLRGDQPSKVIGNYRKNMLIHPSQNRGLSVREAARLQSFPDWFEFEGSIGFQQQQVGNAVPPLLAKAVFGAIVRKSS